MALVCCSKISLSHARPVMPVLRFLLCFQARFVSTLDDLRFKQARAERSAAIRIQSSWRIFAVLRAKAASVSSPGKTAARARASTAVRQQMWDLLAQDARCCGWAFSARQRQRLDEAEAAMAAQVHKGGLGIIRLNALLLLHPLSNLSLPSCHFLNLVLTYLSLTILLRTNRRSSCMCAAGLRPRRTSRARPK